MLKQYEGFGGASIGYLFERRLGRYIFRAEWTTQKVYSVEIFMAASGRRIFGRDGKHLRFPEIVKYFARLKANKHLPKGQLVRKIY